MANNWKVRAERFMNEFIDYVPNFSDYEDYDLLNYVESAVRKFNKDHHRKVVAHHGSARLVLCSSDYVIKMDYNFDQCDDVGGCMEEYAVYNEVVNTPYAYLFAPIHRFCVNGIWFYAMPKYTGIGGAWGRGNKYHWSEDEIEFLRKYTTDLHSYNVGKHNGIGIVIDYACPTSRFEFSCAMGSCWDNNGAWW